MPPPTTAAIGIEPATDTGPADYLMFVVRQPAGVIEAKRDEDGQRLTLYESQTERYFWR